MTAATARASRARLWPNAYAASAATEAPLSAIRKTSPGPLSGSTQNTIAMAMPASSHNRGSSSVRLVISEIPLGAGGVPLNPPRFKLGICAMTHDIHIIGGGLAGSEAAWQLGRRGFRVRLSEMRGG